MKRSGTEELNRAFKVPPGHRVLTLNERGESQRQMRSRKHGPRLRFLSQESNGAAQLPNQAHLAFYKVKVRQCHEYFHQADIITELFAQLPGAQQQRLALRRSRICDLEQPCESHLKVEFLTVTIHSGREPFEYFKRAAHIGYGLGI